MSYIFKNIILVLIILIACNTFGQENETRILKGKLVEGKTALVGATISLVENPFEGVVTDLNGEFELNVPKNKNCKIHIGICVCTKHPKNVEVKKTDKEILLKLKGCEIRKKTVKKVAKK